MADSDTFGSTSRIVASFNRLDDAVDKLITESSSVDTNNVDTKNEVWQPELMTVYLAYAEDELRQHYIALQVSHNTSLYDVLKQAGWLVQFPDLARWCDEVMDVATPAARRWHIGVYSQKQPLSYRLQPFDRIEVYRSLSADPMSQRKNKSQG